MLAILCTMTFPGTTLRRKIVPARKVSWLRMAASVSVARLLLDNSCFTLDHHHRPLTSITNRARSMFYSQPLFFSIPRTPAHHWSSPELVTQSNWRPIGTSGLSSTSWVSGINAWRDRAVPQRDHLELASATPTNSIEWPNVCNYVLHLSVTSLTLPLISLWWQFLLGSFFLN